MVTIPVFPTLYGFSIHKKPTFTSLVQSARSGREVTNFQQANPSWEFELTAEILRDQTQNAGPFTYFSGETEFSRVLELFNYCNAQFGWFFFDDFTDNSRFAQGIAVGDGTTTTFMILRSILSEDSNNIDFTEPVGGVNRNHSVTVYLDGTPLSEGGNWTITNDGRALLNFTTAPSSGVNITMDFYFYYVCRFITDDLDFEQFMKNRWTNKSIRFRSIDPHGLAAPDPLVPPTPIPASMAITYFQPELFCADHDFSGGMTVVVYDSNSNPIGGAGTVSITLDNNPNGASLTGTISVADDSSGFYLWTFPSPLFGMSSPFPGASGYTIRATSANFGLSAVSPAFNWNESSTSVCVHPPNFFHKGSVSLADSRYLLFMGWFMPVNGGLVFTAVDNTEYTTGTPFSVVGVAHVQENQIFLNGAAGKRMELQPTGANFPGWITSPSPAWHQLVMSVDTQAGLIQVLVDGTLSDQSSGGVSFVTDSPFDIGFSSLSASDFLVFTGSSNSGGENVISDVFLSIPGAFYDLSVHGSTIWNGGVAGVFPPSPGTVLMKFTGDQANYLTNAAGSLGTFDALYGNSYPFSAGSVGGPALTTPY